jgi:hypothetical protein
MQKKLKKTKPAESPIESAEWRHKRVIDAWLAGGISQHEAWQTVYPESKMQGAAVNATRLFRSEWGLSYIKEQRQALAEASQITREGLAKSYKDIAQAAVAEGQFAAAKGCLDSIAKMCGMNEPERIIVQTNHLTDDELEQQILAKTIQA